MRTTITIDERLLAKLRKRAAESGTSISRLIEHGIRLLMKAPAPEERRRGFELVTFGAGGRFSSQNIDKTSTLIEADDVDRFAPPGRRRAGQG